MGDGNGPHHCQSSSDLTEMLADYTYKSKEVRCAEKYICQSVSYFMISNKLLAMLEESLTSVSSKLLAIIEEILMCKLLLIKLSHHFLIDTQLCVHSKMGHRRNCVTAVPSLFLIFMSKVFYFR
jgi:hypothetical protein